MPVRRLLPGYQILDLLWRRTRHFPQLAPLKSSSSKHRPCGCGKEQFDALKFLHHLWESFPEIASLYRRVELFLEDIWNITRTKGELLTQSIPMSTALDVRRVDLNCKGLPNEIEFIDMQRQETSVQAQWL